MSGARRVVEVEWVDSVQADGWKLITQLENMKPAWITTVGYVFKSTRDALTLISDLGALSDGGTEGRPICIPKSAIRRVSTLRKK